jgi:hypothetical protein
VTTNYHDIAGQYFVRAFYKYQGFTYPVNENFAPYTITSPEYIESAENPWADRENACGTSKDQNGFLP